MKKEKLLSRLARAVGKKAEEGEPREAREAREPFEGRETREGREGEGEGSGSDIGEEKREMIKGVEELGQTLVREVMVPRIDAFLLSLDMDRSELLEKVASCGHSRIPVYRGSVDRIVGILYAKDLLRALVRGGDFSLVDLVRKPFFVPETKRIDSLLSEMRRRRVHIAIAVDEYGGVSGLVFLEDIIEEIVGEIEDEFDEVREAVISLGEGLWLCDAMADLEDLDERLGLGLAAAPFDTLGGFLFDLFGRIPARTESIVAGGMEFTVQEMSGNRITSVKIRKLEGGE